MSLEPLWPEWLPRLWWREAWLTMEAAEPATLPPYLGSTIRGALGHLLRATLCDGAGCGHDCLQPDACRYFALFEQNRSGAKPLILLAPPLPGLEEIAMGGPVSLPFRSKSPRTGECVPALQCEAGWKIDPGGRLTFGVRLAGLVSNALPAIIDAVARFGLAIGGTPFRLAAARSGSGQLLYDRRFASVPVQMPPVEGLRLEEEPAAHVRIVFLSPTVLKLDRSPTFSPADLAGRFFEHSLGRAVQMHEACTGERLPWVKAPLFNAELVGHRLFHYDLPRHSYRQGKWLDFDGAIGYVDLKGSIGPALPWARAAEALHFGQKAAFGLGKIRVLVLD
jgi:hypothetical protein